MSQVSGPGSGKASSRPSHSSCRCSMTRWGSTRSTTTAVGTTSDSWWACRSPWALLHGPVRVRRGRARRSSAGRNDCAGVLAQTMRASPCGMAFSQKRRSCSPQPYSNFSVHLAEPRRRRPTGPRLPLFRPAFEPATRAQLSRSRIRRPISAGVASFLRGFRRCRWGLKRSPTRRTGRIRHTSHN